MRKLLLVLAVLAVMAPAIPASAGTILLNSQAGLDWTLYAGAPKAIGVTATSGLTVTIQPHPAWDQAPQWISYADTGYGGASFQPQYGNSPIVRILQDFVIPDGQWGTLNLRLWADDTSIAYLNGQKIIDHNPFGPGSACEANTPSCQTDRFGSYTGVVGAGTYELAFDVYQTGAVQSTVGNPFGVKWAGQVDVVPEPGSMLLLGSGLIGVAGAVRRRFARK